MNEDVFVWDKSPTMKMLGKNTTAQFWENHEVKEVINVFRELPEPYKSFYNVTFNHGLNLLFSLYTLGVIHGIRIERKRRKGKDYGTGNTEPAGTGTTAGG